QRHGVPDWIWQLWEQHAPVPRLPTVTIGLRFTLHGDMSFAVEDDPFSAPGVYPAIEVQVGLPLPPPGTIAREYDAVVREVQGWHRELPGGMPVRQEHDVAVRTWAVGLLMVAGQRFSDAQTAVCERTQSPVVSQSRFNDDRRRLLQRVPEARPFLRPG